MNKRRSILTKAASLLVAVMMLATLFACKPSPSASTPASSSPSPSGSGQSELPTASTVPEISYDKEITIEAYVQSANAQGVISGYGGKLWLDKFNVKINVIAPNVAGEAIFQTRSAAGDLGDFIVMGQNKFKDLVTAGLVMDISDLLAERGPNFEFMQSNIKLMNDNIGLDSTYVIPIQGSTYTPLEPLANVGGGMYSYQDGGGSFLRWDMYKEIGMPEIKTMEDMLTILKQMQELHPTADNGQPTYGMALFKDWDWAGMHNILNGFPQMYGYSRSVGMSILIYGDPTDFKYQRIDDDNGLYRRALKFYNEAYHMGLLDPDSATHTWGTLVQKTKDGQILSGLWPWSTITQYNNTDRGNAEPPTGYQFVPISDAKYFNKGYNPVSQWGTVVAIGSKAEEPERLMDILNWMVTPEGMMTSAFGPQGMAWDLDADGVPYSTDFAKAAALDTAIMAPDEFGGGVYSESSPVFFTMYHTSSINPETGLAFDPALWPDAREDASNTKLNLDWREIMGASDMIDYLRKHNMSAVEPGNMFIAPPWTSEQETERSLSAGFLTNYSWQLIYADNDAHFESLWQEFKTQLQGANWEKTVAEDIETAESYNEARLLILNNAG